MNKLNDLIQKFCPDGVNYKSLGELGKFYGGLSGKSKDDFNDGNAKFITYKNVYSNPALQINVDDRVKIAQGEKQHTLQYGDVIFTGSSETPDECGISSIVATQTDEKLYLNSFCFFFRFDDMSLILPDFAKYLFRSSELRYQIGKTASGVTRFNVSKKLMENVRIPLPPLPVQSEIVRILDDFTELTEELIAELTAELTARKKQYTYYKKILFHRTNCLVTLTKIGDICDLLTGFPFDSSAFTETGYRLLRGMNIKRGVLDFSERNNKYWETINGYEKYQLQNQDIVIAMDGSLVGKSYGMVKQSELPLLLVQRVARIRTSKASIRYIYHYITSGAFTEYVEKKKTAGAVPHISLKDIANFTVPLPPIEEQERIVSILDRFDALCNDISKGLPAEIAARQKQYEFYRDKLLTFKEVKA